MKAAINPTNTAVVAQATAPADTPAINATSITAAAPTNSAVMRRVGLAGERAVELRLEVFNLLNTVNFGPPAAQFGPASFGTITTALDPRVVQLAVKFWF